MPRRLVTALVGLLLAVLTIAVVERTRSASDSVAVAAVSPGSTTVVDQGEPLDLDPDSGLPGAVPVDTAPTTVTVPVSTTSPTTVTVPVSTTAANAVPPVPQDSGKGRRIVYGNTAQRIWVIDDRGYLMTTMKVSGRRYVPNPGTYKVYGKAAKTQNMFYPEITMDYMVRFAISPNGKNNIGFHAIPKKNGEPMQTVDELGQFRSGGCVRLAPWDAKWLYHWATIGTKVVVLP